MIRSTDTSKLSEALIGDLGPTGPFGFTVGPACGQHCKQQERENPHPNTSVQRETCSRTFAGAVPP